MSNARDETMDVHIDDDTEVQEQDGEYVEGGFVGSDSGLVQYEDEAGYSGEDVSAEEEDEEEEEGFISRDSHSPNPDDVYDLDDEEAEYEANENQGPPQPILFFNILTN